MRVARAQERESAPPHVRDDAPGAYEATAACDGGKLFAVVWALRRREISSIRACVLHATRRDGPASFRVSDALDGDIDSRPSACWIAPQRLLVAWQRSVGGIDRIVGRIFDDAGAPRTTVFPVSDTAAGRPAAQPDVRRDADGGFVVVWQDFSAGNPDVAYRFFDSLGTARGSVARANTDSGAALQDHPTLARSPAGRLLAIWADNRTGHVAVFARGIGAFPAVPETLVDSAQVKNLTLVPRALWLGERRILCLWKDYRRGTSDIYRRFLRARDGARSAAERVNDDPGDRWQRLPVADADRRHRYVVAWEDYRNTPNNQQADVYLQPYSASGRVVGRNVKANDGDARKPRNTPRIAMNDDGTYLVVWQEHDGARYGVRAQWFRFPTRRVGANFDVGGRISELTNKRINE